MMITVTKKVFEILDNSQKKYMIFLFFMMFIGGIAESLSVSLVLPLITVIMNENSWNDSWYSKAICNIFEITDHVNYIKFLIVLIVCVFLLKNLFLFFEVKCQLRFIADGRFKMQKELMRHYIHKPYSFFLHAQSGEIVRIIADDSAESFILVNNLLFFYTEVFVCIVLGITIFALSPLLALEIGIVLILELIVIGKIVKPIMAVYGESSRSNGALATKWILQSVQGIKSIKVAKKEEFFCATYEGYAEKVVEAQCKNGIMANIPRMFIEACTVAAVMLLVFVMVCNGTDLKLIIPQLSAFIVAAIRLLPSINRISTCVNQISFSLGALDNTISILKSEEVGSQRLHRYNLIEDLDKNARLIERFEIIQLKDVCFLYDERKTQVLNNVSMTIKCGQSVGIIGVSGAGKTTVVDIVLGLLQPQEGSILVNNYEIREVIGSWREKLSYIPQQIFLIDDTIKNNIIFGNMGDMNDEHLWNCLREAQMDEFVRNLPNGVDTIVGEQGVRLSGGQRQRIGIARALYTNPEVLFFDEATSSLDNETENAIMESVNNLKGKKTLIIIAHRLTTIEKCDIVFRVENRKIKRER